MGQKLAIELCVKPTMSIIVYKDLKLTTMNEKIIFNAWFA